MPEPYGTLGATVPESDDYASGGADVPKAFREFTDSVGVGQGKGKILVVQNTGAAAWKALKGDATLAEDGTITIGAKKIVSSMVADALKPSAGAAAGTEALRALGATASTAAAGNDSRLSDERTPKANSVDESKVKEGAVTLAKLAKALGLTEGYYADGSITSRKAKLTGGVVSASSDLTLTTSYQNVPGAKLDIEPSVTSKLRLWLLSEFEILKTEIASTKTTMATVKVDAEAEHSQLARWRRVNPTSTEIKGALAMYEIPLSAGAHTIQVRAKKEETAIEATLKILAPTHFLYELVAA